MNVSIIVPTRNRNETLEETIAHINHTYSTHLTENKLEIIIVNDGETSLDNLKQRYQNLKILKNERPGAGNARNTGAKLAKNELLLFIDDDILIGTDCIEKHVNGHNTYTRSLISGTWTYNDSIIDKFKSTPFGRYKLENDYTTLKEKRENLVVNSIYTCDSLASFNLSVLKSDFVELGGFDPGFPYAGCEDQELTMRAKEKGFTLLLDISNINIHNEKDRVDMDKWLMRQYTGIQGFVALCNLFPYRKKDALYSENTPINRGDSLGMKLKKAVKFLLAMNLPLSLIKQLTALLESMKASDSLLFKLYNLLCGLYIYKGFRYSYKTEIAANKNAIEN